MGITAFASLNRPLPCIPNSDYVKPESYNYQELVVSGRVAGQPNEIETEKNYRYGDVCPATYRIVQDQ